LFAKDAIYLFVINVEYLFAKDDKYLLVKMHGKT